MYADLEIVGHFVGPSLDWRNRKQYCWFIIEEENKQSVSVTGQWIEDNIPELGALYIKKNFLITRDKKKYFEPLLKKLNRLLTSKKSGGRPTELIAARSVDSQFQNPPPSKRLKGIPSKSSAAAEITNITQDKKDSFDIGKGSIVCIGKNKYKTSIYFVEGYRYLSTLQTEKEANIHLENTRKIINSFQLTRTKVISMSDEEIENLFKKVKNMADTLIVASSREAVVKADPFPDSRSPSSFLEKSPHGNNQQESANINEKRARSTRNSDNQTDTTMENIIEGYINCPKCFQSIRIENGGSNVIKCRNHRPLFLYFCVHCKEINESGNNYTTCLCPKRNNKHFRAICQGTRNRLAGENPIVLDSSDDDER
jgi:hypothetical protein